MERDGPTATVAISRADFAAVVAGLFGVFCLILGVYSALFDRGPLGVFVVVGLFWLAVGGYYHFEPGSVSRGTDRTPRHWVELVVVMVVSVLLGTVGLFVFVELV